jgi:hypothetical protein
MVGDRPKPAPLSAEGLFEARANKVMFLNPKGTELYDRVNGRVSRFGFDYEQTERKKRVGMEGENLAVHGRPLK